MDKQDGQSAALDQASSILEQEIGDAIVPQVQATKKALGEFKKDMVAAIKSGKTTLTEQEFEKIIAPAETNVRLAEQYKEIALQKLKEAPTAANPAMRYVLLRDVIDKTDMVRELLNPVSVILSKPREKEEAPALQPKEEPGVQAPRPIPSINIQSSWYALEQAKISAGLSDKGYTYAAVGEYQTDAIKYDPSSQTLTAPGGRSVDVRYLQGTFTNTPPAAQEAIFEPIPVPISVVEGKPQAVQLKESAEQGIYSQENQEVGGVALKVTLDLLSFLHVAGFSRRGPDITVESPVLISLKGLYKTALPYSRSPEEWKKLPESLRHPAKVERIYGFVLDPRNQDIFLICAPARSQETCLDIDDLIVGFQAAWLKQLAPSVSLDPLPNDLGGPQYVRVFDTPRDSLFAKIMLEADYAMKQITLGHLKVKADGFQSLAQLAAAQWQGP
ncbi:MAG: DUF1598 domain-containing protein [Candidatus Omnitrophica bacterium]|nr:DUF1598 domain-containing protein [Candidatus Omnitrophota bacterium]